MAIRGHLTLKTRSIHIRVAQKNQKMEITTVGKIYNAVYVPGCSVILRAGKSKGGTLGVRKYIFLKYRQYGYQKLCLGLTRWELKIIFLEKPVAPEKGQNVSKMAYFCKLVVFNTFL